MLYEAKRLFKTMNGYSQTPKEERIKLLQSVMPEIFDEGKIDWEKLRAALGEEVNFANERYRLNWAGKSDAFRIMQEASAATLVPCREESVDFDNTQNIFIEGENMEVLKVLQKSYFNKVKMIYIDPPYNTGNDSFIYPDRFSESREEYMRRVGDKDEEGYMLRDGLFHKNSKENGQYHSNWLNMMMPRLYLAHSLLRDDGVIFVSIDDNEVHNLRLLMNEIFGEDNFIGQLTWLKKRKGSFLTAGVISLTEYILIYGKSSGCKLYGGKANESESQPLIKRTNSVKTLSFPAALVHTKLEDGIYRAGKYGTGTSAVNLQNDISVVNGIICDAFSITGPFIWSQENLDKQIKLGASFIINTKNFQVRTYKVFQENQHKGLSSFIDGVQIQGTNEDAYEQLIEIFEQEKIMDYPKPINLIKGLIESGTYFNKDSLILDFFAGSGTTAHAVMQLNKEDGGNRKYICVQLPEPCDENSEAAKAGYKTIADIAKERIRRAGAKIRAEAEAGQPGTTMPDTGFKAFRLADSNFKQWRKIRASQTQAWQQQIMEFIDPVAETATVGNMVYELLLKNGKDLNSTIEYKDGCYMVNGRELLLLLESATQQTVDAVLAARPEKVVALDRLFEGNDQLKTNTALQMKDAGITFITI